MDLSPKQELVRMPLLRKRLRQMRGFDRAFKEHNRLVASHLNILTGVDDRRLHQAFFNWVMAIGQVEHDEGFDRADRIVFMGGLALRELLRARPVTVLDASSMRTDDATFEGAEAISQIAKFWPEGFIYTNFCICSIAAVHEQEFGQPRQLDKIAYDLRTWWSFRENAAEDISLSIGFLDSFFGVTPNWLFPDSSKLRRERPAQELPMAPTEP